MSKKALIVVDMLNDFVNTRGALYCGDKAARIVPFIRERVKAFRASGNMVVYLQDAHDENDKEFEKFPTHCVAGTWGSQVIPELTPATGEPVLSKKRYSGFYGTSLAGILEDSGIESVEVVGVCTSICVMDTVGGLANRDYEVIVPISGVADFDAQFHAFALERMKKLYGADVS